MSLNISVLISTYNPNAERLRRTLQGLLAQTLAADQWELVLIDNASTAPPDPTTLDLMRFKNWKLVIEPRLGLTFGRLAGIYNSEAPIVVFVDDDNVLAPDYLEQAINIVARNPNLGAGGGRSLPEWLDKPPEPWAEEFVHNLAVRDLGGNELLHTPADEFSLPHFAPIGAGMVARREALSAWIDAAERDGAVTDRKGDELSTSGDADIVLHVIRSGWTVGYFPGLVLTHLMPSGRLTLEYLARHTYWLCRSWIQVLDRHGIRPFPPAAPLMVPLRKWRAYVRQRGWAGPAEYVRWKGSCGIFDGRATMRPPSSDR